MRCDRIPATERRVTYRRLNHPRDRLENADTWNKAAHTRLSVPHERFLRRLASDAGSKTRMVASGELPTPHLGGRVYLITHKLRSFINGRRGRRVSVSCAAMSMS
jgi:hypothetical protein